MLPTRHDSLHVRSSNVVIDGVARPACVELDHSGVVLAIDDRPATSRGPVDGWNVGSDLVVPAPLDLHFHGAGGHVVPPEGDVEAIDAALAAASRSAGWHCGPGDLPAAYQWVATLPIPATPPREPVAHVAACARAIAEAGDTTGCVGIRIEGLFLNPARAGVWPPETFLAPSVALLDDLHAAAADGGSRLLVVDVAPELPGAIALIERMGELGIVASLAHSDATFEQAAAAIDAGARLATHTWNAMRPMTHRDPGIVGAVLSDPRVTCELICDGVHLHPATTATSIAAKGSSGWIAVSDASPFAGCEPGQYEWAGTTITHDGIALRDPAGHLAGSVSLLDRAFEQVRSTSVPLVEVALALGATPRRVLDPDRSWGLEVGDPAWIVPAPRPAARS